VKVHGATIVGGSILGDRLRHLGTTGEWGMGIGIYNCDSITIKHVHISECWGDGITVGAQKIFSAPNPSTRVYIIGVVSDSNRRQGLSIGQVSGVTVDSCFFINTSGTAPQDGIDIEPDTGTCRNITITNSVMNHNAGNGVELNENKYSSIYNVNVNYNTVDSNHYGVRIGRNISNINVSHNYIVGNTGANMVIGDSCTSCVTGPNP
jgi:hypothetical protein